MNLKESFRYQNYLSTLFDNAMSILNVSSNVTTTVEERYYKKANPEADDEKVVIENGCEYADSITKIANFAVFLLKETEKLSNSIHNSKIKMEFDLDGFVSVNTKRRSLAKVFANMKGIKSTERLLPGGCVGYKFNQEGNQMSYRCDAKRITSINFDRNVISSAAEHLFVDSDAASDAIDKALINTEVAYMPPFNVNSSFADAFDEYCKE